MGPSGECECAGAGPALQLFSLPGRWTWGGVNLCRVRVGARLVRYADFQANGAFARSESGFVGER